MYSLAEKRSPHNHRFFGVGGVAAVLIILAPAFFNGFPFLFDDTGGYLDGAYRWNPDYGRSIFYGMQLRFLSAPGLGFWPSVLLQAGVIFWVIHLFMKAFGQIGPWWLLPAISLGLTLFTPAAWFIGQLMPDVWGPAMILSFALLAAVSDRLTKLERTSLTAVIAFTCLAHMSYLGIACGLLICFGLWNLVPALKAVIAPAIRLPALAVAFAISFMLLFHGLVTGTYGLTPGGNVFILGRLIQDGIVKDYLAEVCPAAGYKLCMAGDSLPTTANEFLWGDGVTTLNQLGNFKEMEVEAGIIVYETLKRYPVRHFLAALENTAQQFVTFSTGDGFDALLWHTKWVFEKRKPDVLDAFYSAIQQTGQTHAFDLSPINLVHTLAAFSGLLACFALLALAVMKDRSLTLIIATLLLALLGNAMITGVLSNVQGRYQSRLIWLTAVVAFVAWQKLGRPLPFRR
jgi:hypothetical protein